QASGVVDLANAAYALMLRLIAHSYSIVGPDPEKALVVDLAITLMQSVTLLAERAARMPAGPSNPGCNAGMSFTALRDAAPLPAGAGARRFFIERLDELARVAQGLVANDSDRRMTAAASKIADLAARAGREFARIAAAPQRAKAAAPSAPTPVPKNANAIADGGQPRTIDGVEEIEANDLTLLYEGKRCIHSRFCVTYGPKAFLANVPGPWIFPDRMPVEDIVEIAHACPSGAIRYRRKDGHADEQAPPVNLLQTRENGPYGVRADMLLDGKPIGYRDAMPLRRLEEQAVLRPVAQGDRLRRDRRAGERQDRHARSARRRARCRSRARR